ncbi:MAG: hypothetical protein ACOX7J_08680 [Bacillota bacterium]|jgi:hypothetical protein
MKKVLMFIGKILLFILICLVVVVLAKECRDLGYDQDGFPRRHDYPSYYEFG